MPFAMPHSLVQLCHSFSPHMTTIWQNRPHLTYGAPIYSGVWPYIDVSNYHLLRWHSLGRPCANWHRVANMLRGQILRFVGVLAAVSLLASCGALRNLGGTGETTAGSQYSNPNVPGNIETNPNNTIWSIFNRPNNETNVAVNKYLWNATLEVLNFLPIQSVDPFTGVIVTGYGTPPGGGRAYRATVLIDDPALDARSLNIALQSRGGPVSRATSRAVEDAILSRARQLRIADNKL